jgi:glutamate-1-semialdehyde aminotransferase/spore coat polysaccharide biosynthesis protein SpsF (cytidylyltransferase family)
MNSTRLPGKVLKKITDKSAIEILLDRLSQAEALNKVIIATSDNPKDEELKNYLINLNFKVYSGSERDVLNRFFLAAKSVSADVIVRISGDCPCIDPVLINKMISTFLTNDLDYCSNVINPTFPDGLDIEVFSFAALERANAEAHSSFDREHVTPFIKDSNLFKVQNVSNKKDFSQIRLTLDESEDLVVLQKIFEHFSPKIDFTWQEAVEYLNLNQDLLAYNKKFKRNEGSQMSTGQKLYKRAKKIIPGGNMLLSKRPEMFLPDLWPSYFSKAKGIHIWDLDNKKYLDISLMGVGTNILGYGNDEVDHAVSSTISSGNMSTLNCPEEVYLAEKLVEMHPWSNMVKFARTGGEANAIAIRIARAASGKDKIAICGYHGWHDWYLASNIDDPENLSQHLLSGLEANGVPKALKGTTIPFQYNDFDSLSNIVSNGDIGAIKMEVFRNVEPKDNFLQRVRKLANDNGIVLIFDECTSGFRETFGGLHKKYDVEPDIALFSKALGNGYAICSILGREEVMESAQSSFISSTFWTERIGPTAALKTLEIMQRDKSWEYITELGKKLCKSWKDLSEKHKLPITISGLPAISSFNFNNKHHNIYKTFITQELLAKGIIANTAVYLSTEHNEKNISYYLEELDEVFYKLNKNEKCEKDPIYLLKGQACHSGFSRLN